jgi:hypothetical protein
MNRAIALYPRAWRERYEAEFLVLLAEHPPGPRETVDIVRGAIDARLHPHLVQADMDERDTANGSRLSGLLGIVGGLFWIAAAFAMYGSTYYPHLGYKDTSSAVFVAVAAGVVTGLSAMTIQRSIPGARSVIRMSAIAIVAGGLGMAAPWPIVLLGFFSAIIGTMLFGLAGAALRLGPSATLLSLGGFAALLFNTEDDRALFLIPLGVAWIVLGIAVALRGFPRPLAGDSPVVTTDPSPVAR